MGTVAARTLANLTMFDNACTSGPVIARSASGIELSCRTDPICPDETWNLPD